MSTHPEPEVSRLERLLGELAARYDLDRPFLARLRPLAAAILADGTLAGRRTELLELLAETCERHRRIERGGAALRQALEDLVRPLVDLEQALRRLKPDQR